MIPNFPATLGSCLFLRPFLVFYSIRRCPQLGTDLTYLERYDRKLLKPLLLPIGIGPPRRSGTVTIHHHTSSYQLVEHRRFKIRLWTNTIVRRKLRCLRRNTSDEGTAKRRLRLWACTKAYANVQGMAENCG